MDSLSHLSTVPEAVGRSSGGGRTSAAREVISLFKLGSSVLNSSFSSSWNWSALFAVFECDLRSAAAVSRYVAVATATGLGVAAVVSFAASAFSLAMAADFSLAAAAVAVMDVFAAKNDSYDADWCFVARSEGNDIYPTSQV